MSADRPAPGGRLTRRQALGRLSAAAGVGAGRGERQRRVPERAVRTILVDNPRRFLAVELKV